MLDGRGVQRLLEKLLGLAETATDVGMKSAEVMLRTANLSDTTKAKLLPLYQNEARARARGHARLGLDLCAAVEDELADAGARAELERFRAAFHLIHEQAMNDKHEI